MTGTDSELLAEFVQHNSQAAFATLVNRHLNLVHSAALRQVRSPELAEEIAQSVFADLAKSAPHLKTGTILTAWLYQVTRRTAIDTIRRESRRQARERLAAEMTAMNASADWNHIEPLLDEAMDALDESDRAAVLLRYFENKSLREVGASLGTSDDAAQKRVSRAVEQLREFFAKRGATIAVGALVTVITANAVQAAPIGLAAAIVTSALAGTATVSTTLAATTKAVTMTTLQKATIAGALAAALGFAVVEAKKYSSAKSELEAFQQTQRELAQSMEAENAKAAQQIANLKDENTRLNQNASELLKLRGEVTKLKNNTAKAATGTFPGAIPNDNSPLVPVSGRVTFAATNQVPVKWGDTVVTGGWKLLNGNQVYLLVTPKQAQDPTQLLCQIKIVETGLANSDSASNDKLLGTMDQSQIDMALKQWIETGSGTVREMQIATASGTQASIKTGSSEDDAGSIELLPVISQDGQTVDMKITSMLNYPK